MANRLIIHQLDRITLVRKGRATAKHPDLRAGVVEVVKAEDADWYERFAYFIQQTEDDAIPTDWVEAFSAQQEAEEVEGEEGQVTKAKSHAGAKPGQNYASSKGPFAGPHSSFPIQSQQDVYNAARLVGHAQDPASVKSRIIRIARSKGFSLPKSWSKGTSVKKSELIAKFKEFFGVVIEDDEPETSEETPPGEPEMVEKAGGHTHDHPHQSLRGYGYSHSHAHGHKGGVMPNTDAHTNSDVAHAHDHISKAGENPELDGIVAENEGLAQDLEAAKVSVKKAEDAEAAAQETIKELREKLDAAEKALAEAKGQVEAVEKAKNEAESLLKAQSREPQVGGPVTNVAKSHVDIKSMKFDEAFDAVLHG
jgi:hypothetical protein